LLLEILEANYAKVMLARGFYSWVAYHVREIGGKNHSPLNAVQLVKKLDWCFSGF